MLELAKKLMKKYSIDATPTDLKNIAEMINEIGYDEVEQLLILGSTL